MILVKNMKMEEYFMAYSTTELMVFLGKFVREVPQEPVIGMGIDVQDFAGKVNHIVPLQDRLNEVPGSHAKGVRKAVGEGRYLIAYWDDPEMGDLEHCGIVLREIGKGRR